MGQKLAGQASDSLSTVVVMFPSNLHLWDRIARLLLGAVMFAVGWYSGPTAWAMALRVFAFYPVVTGLAGWCPIYALLRFRTKR